MMHPTQTSGCSIVVRQHINESGLYECRKCCRICITASPHDTNTVMTTVITTIITESHAGRKHASLIKLFNNIFAISSEPYSACQKPSDRHVKQEIDLEPDVHLRLLCGVALGTRMALWYGHKSMCSEKVASTIVEVTSLLG